MQNEGRRTPDGAPGRREQRLLKEDPGVLEHRMQDPATERAIGERRADERRQQLEAWWSALGEDEMLKYLNKRDELLLLLYEQYRYTPDEASREAEALLSRLSRR